MKRTIPFVLMIVLVSGLIFDICAKSTAEAISAADFYKKNIVTMVVGFSPGGGSDYAARLLASYWPEVTNGGVMVIKNMGGAGGLTATNYVNSAKPDGLTVGFGMFPSAYLMPVLTKDPAVRYDAKKLQWLVGVFNEPWTIHISTKRPYETVEDLKKAKGLIFPTLSPVGGATIAEAFFIDILGLDAKIVTGYKTGGEQVLAAGKGEADITAVPAAVGLDGMNKGFVKPPVVIMGRKRLDAFPGTPAFPELVKFTSEQEAQFNQAYVASYVSRVGAARPGVPEDRVKFMRDAFAKILAMKGFAEKSKSFFPLGPTPMIGEELNAFMKEAFSINIDPVNAQIRKYLSIK